MEIIILRNEDGSHFIAKIYWGEYRVIHIGMRSPVGFLETYTCNENSRFKVF